MVYKKQIGLGFVGVAICAMPVILPLIPQIGAYAEAERVKAEMELRSQNLRTSEEFERERISERAKTSEELYKAGLAPNATKLRMRRYFDNSRRDPKPDTTGWGFDEVVYVYDSAGRCIGRIEQNQWLWKHKYENACDGRPS
ncbi:hypothetical protein WA1_51545 [Scytonema hofmannii PCC 7110]|uniref:Uncharacterized protein n=1 Tax=Scytonema hofmannii PCC 7110 TaxID=128403 RepID=A0A139WPX1_9CYAN|nr:hypothetical protein [Scytonema hofmannii]KYC34480.1 hypothetical protein WA1_51545 [Scytonema hofmannii PCC 7110]